MIFHWSFNPVIFSIGKLSVHWYGLCWVFAFLFGEYAVKKTLRGLGYSKNIDISSLMIMVLIGTVIGARIAHVVFYDPTYYFEHPLKIFEIWEGGLASHGGVIGFIVSIAYWSRKFVPNVPFLTLLDASVISASLGGAFVRIGNFLNSEIVGIPTSGTWGVVFTRVDSIPRHPVQLYEALAYIMISIILFIMYKRMKLTLNRGVLTGLFLILIFIARIILEFWKTRQASYAGNFSLSIGQLLSLPFILIGIVILIRSKNNKKLMRLL